jgi:hypothetical protein
MKSSFYKTTYGEKKNFRVRLQNSHQRSLGSPDFQLKESLLILLDKWFFSETTNNFLELIYVDDPEIWFDNRTEFGYVTDYFFKVN